MTKIVGVPILVYGFVVLILNSSFKMIPHTTKVSCQIIGQGIATDRYRGENHNSLQTLMVQDDSGYFLCYLHGHIWNSGLSIVKQANFWARSFHSGIWSYYSNGQEDWDGSIGPLNIRSPMYPGHYRMIDITFTGLLQVSSLSVFFGLLLSYTNFKAPISTVSVC